MLTRCRNPRCDKYQYYGGRGITVKFQSFSEFFAEVGPRPKGQSIDRIDTNGHYAPGNVRWATKIEQMRNRPDNRLFTWQGRSQTIRAWAEEIGINAGTLYSRLCRGHWTVDRTFTTPAKVLHRNRLPLSESK
jgi:hypothetical protein